MKEFVSYAPIIIVVVMFFTQYKIFARPDDLSKLKEDLKGYITDNFVSKESCTSSNKHIQEVISLTSQSIKEDVTEIKDDIKELKELLLSKK